jgi:GDSL-like lipase/acylhydrolase family protein
MSSLTTSVLKLAAILCATVVALLLTEGVVRLAAPAYDPSGSVTFTNLPDGTPVGPTNVVRRQRKNTGDYDVEVRFNALGLRDVKPLNASTPDSIFVVGDSFAFGWGVEEPQRFSNLVQARLGRPVFNISAPADFEGYEDLLRYAEKNGATIGTLIVSVCMENDLRVYEGPEVVTATPEIGDVKAFLSEHSATYFLVTTALHRTPWLVRTAVRLGLVVPNFAEVEESDISDAAVLSSSRRLTRLIGARRALVLIVPSRALWVGTEQHRRQAARAHEMFIRLLAQAGLTVIDVRERFEREGHPLANHFATDGHWNAAGHRLAADALAEYFRSHRSAESLALLQSVGAHRPPSVRRSASSAVRPSERIVRRPSVGAHRPPSVRRSTSSSVRPSEREPFRRASSIARSRNRSHRKHAPEILAEDLASRLRACADLVECRRLLLVHAGHPSPREERRIGAEQQPLGADDGERLTEDAGESHAHIFDPGVRARGVEQHVGAQVRQHQRLAKHARAEMRNDDRHVRIRQRHRL